MNKSERLIELFKNKPEAYVITFPAQAVAYMIQATTEGLYVPQEGEDAEEPNTPEGVWACYLASLPQPEPVADPQIGEDN